MQQLQYKHDVQAFQESTMHKEISAVLREYISQKINETQKNAKIQEIADRYKHRPEIQAWAQEMVQAALSVK